MSSGVEPARERGRADEVSEHHSQLATFGVLSPGWLARRGHQGRRYGSRSVAEIADRAQQFAPITEQDTEVFKVLVREVGKDAQVNAIFDKAIGVLGHPEHFEPVRNLLHRGHQDLVGPHSTTAGKSTLKETAKACFV
jgi:hypothetical protein